MLGLFMQAITVRPQISCHAIFNLMNGAGHEYFRAEGTFINEALPLPHYDKRYPHSFISDFLPG
jgi:hypothetical protein